jgi:zinc/manganese transport system substrate-binding protein
MRPTLLALALLSTLAARDAAADLRVVATVPDLAAIAREVGGAHVTVTSLSLYSQDPHTVDPRPSLVLDVARADLLLAVGMDLEVGWLPPLQLNGRNARVQPGGRGYLDCSAFVRVLGAATGPVDRSRGDVHPVGNPHYLRDPRAATAVAAGIAERLATLDPARRADYEQGLAAFRRRIDAARLEVERRLADHRGARIVTYHASWTYVVDWLGLEEVGSIEPRPGVPPSPAHVARLIGLARERGARLVVQERYHPSGTGRLVAARLGGALATLPGGTDFHGGQAYPEYIAELGAALARGLGQ